jgi:hypothetical protein
MIWTPSIRILNVDHTNVYSWTFWFSLPNTIEYAKTLRIVINCPLDFSDFPFDSHECFFKFGDSAQESERLLLTSPTAYYGSTATLNGSIIKHTSTRLPYDVEISALEPFIFDLHATDEQYSFTGFKIVLIRNTLGRLVGGFFGLTGVFSVLSIGSYIIPPEQVYNVPQLFVIFVLLLI